MYISRNDELIKEILEVYDIPFCQTMINCVDKILFSTYLSFSM